MKETKQKKRSQEIKANNKKRKKKNRKGREEKEGKGRERMEGKTEGGVDEWGYNMTP